MSKPVVLVTSMQLSEPAQQILREAGLEIAFVPKPTTEESSIAALTGATKGSLLRVGTMAATNIVRHLRGEAPNPDNLVS